MYQIGDIVVYGTEGIAEIGEEIEREFDGQKLKYLVLHPLEKKTETVYVPVGNEKAMRKLRSILSEKEAETLIDALPQERPDWIKNDRERQKVYRDTLLFGSSREVLAMARALYLHPVSYTHLDVYKRQSGERTRSRWRRSFRRSRSCMAGRA